jgi:hypothetical protein
LQVWIYCKGGEAEFECGLTFSGPLCSHRPFFSDKLNPQALWVAIPLPSLVDVLSSCSCLGTGKLCIADGPAFKFLPSTPTSKCRYCKITDDLQGIQYPLHGPGLIAAKVACALNLPPELDTEAAQTESYRPPRIMQPMKKNARVHFQKTKNQPLLM